MKIRIVIADDYQLVRRGFRAMLEQEPNIEVVGEAENGRQCLDFVEQFQPDVVIMDVTMPVLNGIEATRQILARSHPPKVVAVSMHPERQFVTEMLSAGASAYVFKDSRVEELVTAIETVMRGETYLSPKLTGVLFKNCMPASRAPRSFGGNLSPRERQVLQMIADGKNTKEIAYLLYLSTKTVEGHRRQVMEKLNLYSVAELTRYAIREGMTSLV